MNHETNRMQSLCEALLALIEQEAKAGQELLAVLDKGIGLLQEETRDPRLPRLLEQIKKHRQRSQLFAEMSRRDFGDKMIEIARLTDSERTEARLGRLLLNLIRLEGAFASSRGFASALLDGLITETGAQRGFLLLYLPESTEAEILSARHFQTAHLSASEYGLSRTVLRQVFEQGRPLLVADATNDSRFANAESIRGWKMLSILAVPMKEKGRTIGAIYLDHQMPASRFETAEQQLVEEASRFAVACLRRLGFLPYLQPPKRRVYLDAAQAPRELMGNHPKILEVVDVVGRIANKPVTVLIEGESGTGKELVARALHYQSNRAKRPFVAINCAAIPRDLLESELFGHEKGAFTGATSRFLGQVQEADGGTLLLDEVGELDTALQAKLLRFLQQSEFRRLGGQEVQKVDVRIVAATSRQLPELVEAGKFQAALYYRLNVIPLHVPPLRERKEDIPLLVDHFLDKFSSAYGRTFRIEREALDLLQTFQFPGNVRELENVIHRMAALAEDETLRLVDLPLEILQINSQRIGLGQEGLLRVLSCPPKDLEELRLREEEIRHLFSEQRRQLAEKALERAGNVTAAASQVGVHRATLHKMLGRRKVEEDEGKDY